MSRPIDIAHSPARNVLIIQWSDGARDELSVPYLRGWCPCASCQGHGTVAAFHAPPDGVRIDGIEEVGAYAIGIRFSDGHDSGIFTWSWLNSISPRADPPGLKYGSFVGGSYHLPAGPAEP